MKILPVTDPAFDAYGQILAGYDLRELLSALAATPLPDGAPQYVPEQAELMALPIAEAFSARAYGGMPIQLGWCNGHNTKLNCLEYHRDSELNLGTKDFILLLGKRGEIENGRFDTAKTTAFRVPAGVLVEIYATSLHYAPCESTPGEGFQVLIVLPRGTNTAKPALAPQNDEDLLLTARNKWLLAHPDSPEAADGAQIRLDGENIDLAHLL